MDTINPQILPSTLTKKEHHRAAVVGLWVLVVALLVAAIYWLGTRTRTPQTSPVVDTMAEKKAQVEAVSVRSSENLTAAQIKEKEALLKSIKR